jgi:predicted phosphodiesterase
MRLAALYDIHGNLPALEAVLRDVRREGVDQLIIGGDVLPGPMPRETLDCLLGLDIPLRCIHGNGDRAVLEQMAGKTPDYLPVAVQEVIAWVAQQLAPEHERELRSWPGTLHVDVPVPGGVLFCHATPRNDTEIFTRLTSDDRLRPVFEGVTESLVVCGHTHMQFDRMVGNLRVVNAGSVGMPFGKPGAYWLLLDEDVALRETTLDLTSVADHIRAAAYPHAADFVARNVLDPPSEAAMLDIYSRSEVR